MAASRDCTVRRHLPEDLECSPDLEPLPARRCEMADCGEEDQCDYSIYRAECGLEGEAARLDDVNDIIITPSFNVNLTRPSAGTRP